MTTKSHYHKKRETSYCFLIEDAIAWTIGWIDGCILGCCVSCYVEEIVEPGIAEEVVLGAFRGYTDMTHTMSGTAK